MTDENLQFPPFISRVYMINYREKINGIYETVTFRER